MSTIHVMIEQPGESRHDLLNATLNSAEFLKNYEDLVSLEEKKKFYRKKIEDSMKEVRILHSKVFDSLPRIDDEFADEKVSPVRKPSMKKDSRKVTVPARDADLQNDIDEIRKKISGLNIRKI